MSFESDPYVLKKEYLDHILHCKAYDEEFASNVDWGYLSRCHKLSIEFIRIYKDKLIWKIICYEHSLTVVFMDEFHEYLNWINISRVPLPEWFIEKYKFYVHWPFICQYQVLSEEFIIEHLEFIDFWIISKYQDLSEKFIVEHFDRLYLPYIDAYQKISDEIHIRLPCECRIRDRDRGRTKRSIVNNWIEGIGRVYCKTEQNVLLGYLPEAKYIWLC